jgi:excisionase family DNA binding protein
MAHPLARLMPTAKAGHSEQTRQVRSEMFEQQLGRSVTIDQAAALLHVSRRTIYNRIREGKLQTIRTIGGSQRVLLTSLDENRKPMWADLSEPVIVRRDSSQSHK